MNQERPEKSVERGVWAALAVAVLVVVAAYLAQTFRRQPPDSGAMPAGKFPVISQVSDFVLTNQLGKSVRLADLLGHVWVADIIFTRCPGPCVRMTRSMSEVRNQFLDREEVAWVSITADPDYDTPQVLSEYAAKWVDHPKNWNFLTGPKSAIVKLAADDLKLVVVDKDPAQRMSDDDLFLHSTKFVLLDRRGRLRGVYEGTEKEARDLLVKDLRTLLEER